MRRGRLGVLVLLAAVQPGCSREARLLASDQPQTAPSGTADPRTAGYVDNYYQVAQGGRYFTWYGCANCHGAGSRTAPDLSNGSGKPVPVLYAAMTSGAAHPGYDKRIPPEQSWQIAAWLNDAAHSKPERNRRNSLDQQGEPQGPKWSGPLL